MDMIAAMAYGTQSHAVEIKNAASIETILPKTMQEIEDVKDYFIRAITEDVIGSKPLKELIAPTDQVTIVISDITRSWMHQEVLVPLMVSYLHEEMGLPYQNMTILIALGTHRSSTPEEMVKLVTQDVFDKVKVIDHDCDAADQVYVGTTSRGTQVRVDPLVIGRKVIVIGGTVHHMMAGFGGGRKSILPGVASRETIRQNHRRALDPVRPMTDERVGCCKLLANPIHEDMAEAAALVDVTFSVNLVVSASGKYSGIFCGDLDMAWQASCQYQKECYEVPIDHLADVVVCSTGGHPKDMNLYQGCKGMLNAMRALKPGGTMLWFCKCPEGGGAPDYFAWLKPLQEGNLDPALRADFTIGGYIFYLTVEEAHKAGKLLTYTELDPALVKPIGLTASTDLEDLMQQVDFTGKSVYVLPYAGSVVPVLA